MFKKIYSIMPVFIKEKIMHRIILNGYAKNDYNVSCRRRALTEHERNIIDMTFSMSGKSNPTVLDIGCGDARLFGTYMRSKGGRITGIDISPRQIKAASMNLPTEKFLCIDFMKFSTKQPYDIITAFYSIYNIPRQLHKKLFNKIKLWLKDNGVALILIRVEGVGDFNYWSDWCGAEMVFSYDDHDVMIRYAKEAGFKVQVHKHEDNDEYLWLLLTK